ncbi:MAG: single-stranded-DNA-specific exonuclease RecJ [Clostridia bacterium]|nr:single-stranded-DNA-specific exonuclease RecJ [Clostridia bacterium]
MRNTEQIISEILNKRGICTEEELAEFLSVKPTKTYDPFLLDGVQEGVDLLLSEIEKGSRVCVYGDYDADGVTAVCVMSCALNALDCDWFYYIPSRFEEGYGLNVSALEKIKAEGAGIVITVDCGCVSKDEVAFAQSIGLKMIVTDHHNIEDVMADCIVIDPKKPEHFLAGAEPYPCPDLAGCGVAFKFIQALQRTAGLPKSILNDALDMVAVGTVGDIVPLRDENRTLVKYGTAIANSGRRPALRKLAESISIAEINSENIAFGIVPHINACGRMDSAREAVKLFLTDDAGLIDEQVGKLVHFNSDRKKIQDKAYESCLSQISGDENFIVLVAKDMHEGIAGIVAGKLKDRFNRSVIIVTPSGDGFLKGTGRSIPKIDIYGVLSRINASWIGAGDERGDECGDERRGLFERFGGHRSACGFLMKEENLEALREGVEAQLAELLAADPELFEVPIETDTYLEPAEVSVELGRQLKKIAPFGEGNPSPKFAMNNVQIRGLDYMGEDRIHARFSATDGGVPAAYVSCVLFRQAQELRHILESDRPVSMIGSLSHQVWRGQEKVQFIVENIEIEEEK